MSGSGDDDLTIVSSWAPKAYSCFAAEFEELEQLKQQHEQTSSHAHHDLEARCMAEVDLQIQRDYPDVYPLLTAAAPSLRGGAAAQSATPPSGTSIVGGSASKRPKNKQAQQQLQAEVAMVAAKRDALLQRQMQLALVAQDRQPAQQLAARYTAQLAATQKSVRMYLEKESHELQRFSSRPLASYALGEVLETPPAAKPAAMTTAVLRPPSAATIKSAAATPAKRDGGAGASSASRAASERGSARSSVPRKAAPRATLRSVKSNLASSMAAAGTRSRRQSATGRRFEAAAVVTDGTPAHGASEAARPPPFLIDAHQFAVEYNEMLKREYGYKPAMTNAFPTAAKERGSSSSGGGGAAESPEVVNEDGSPSPSGGGGAASLQEMLHTHVPGRTTKRERDRANGSPEGKGWLPPIASSTQHTFAADKVLPGQGHGADGGQQARQAGTEAHDKDGERTAEQQRFAHSSPALPSRAKDAQVSHTGKQQQQQRKAAAASRPLASKSRDASPSSSLAVMNGIDCPAKAQGVRFSTFAGEPVSQTLRFVNRNAYRTRLRLKASAHPWLTYRCTRISPAAGSPPTASSGASDGGVPPETPLNCGGFMEVEVTFCPASIEQATAVVDAVLEMGVARELNDRSSEGAQWQFLPIAVRGQVVLPHFEWWRSGTLGLAEQSSGSSIAAWAAADQPVRRGSRSADSMDGQASAALLPCAALAACASPLALHEGETVDFGDALLLASVQQTLFLENTGSSAVVHVLSSSPEFALSVAAEVATLLPTAHALPLRVTFSPLHEGPREATLTVAVRASSDPDSVVLSEHVVALCGSGVVPRVSISALGSQVVAQRDGMPQWQASASAAPLHTVMTDTMPGVPAAVSVAVRNDCAVPLHFHWEGECDVPQVSDVETAAAAAEAQGESEESEVADFAASQRRVATLTARSCIAPAAGVLPAFSTSSFVLTVTPASLQPLQTLYSLFLDGLPDPADEAAAGGDRLSLVDAEVLEFYRRSRPVPCTVHQHDLPSLSPGSVRRVDLPHCDRAMQVAYLDPITAFARFRRSPAVAALEASAAGGVAGSSPSPLPPSPPCAVFATSFLTYQQPSLPSLTITPSVVEEHVECLLKCRQTRTVTLHNNATVGLHFVLDPTAAEFTQSLEQPLFASHPRGGSGAGADAATALSATATTFERWRSFFPVSDGITVQCQPRKGLIPAHGTVTVTVHFTVEAIGPHFAVVPCWIPELEQLRALLTTAGPALRTAPSSQRASLSLPASAGSRGASASRRQPMPPPGEEAGALGQRRGSERRRLGNSLPGTPANALTTLSRSPAEDALRIIEEGGCYAVNVTATGVGATVKASTDLLDFGLIELGQEAAASFTVSNPNAIPVVFDLCDPLMRHPPRFVFIPESFRLGAGNTVEVTVYRKAVSTDDAQTFFELTVRDGGASIAVETRATIQQPLLVVDSPVVRFGVVPEGVWQTGTFRVSNRSAIDTDFTIAAATPPPPYMEVEHQEGVVLRAGEELEVPVRCRFRCCDAAAASGLRGATQTVESCYSTLLGLVSKRSRQTLLVEVRCEGVEKLSVSVDVVASGSGSGEVPVATYLRALLMNAVEAALAAREGGLDVTVGLDAASLKSLPLGNAALTVWPLCPPAHIVDFMPDDVPVARRAVDVVLTNYTGGDAAFALAAQRYAPQSMVSIGAQGILDKKKAATAKAAQKASTRGDESKAASSLSRSLTANAEEEGDSDSAAAAAASMPAFWSATVSGGATVQQAQRQIVEQAQKVLGDGSGCATLLSAMAGVLRAHGTVRVPVHLWCALPGRYLEHLCVRGDPTLPLLRIPVTYEVYGKPVVLDGTTSGLTRGGGEAGEDVLLMPPVIAPLGTSRRTIRLINRAARDMEVAVEAFPCPMGMTVHAVDPDVPADLVELKLVTMTEADKRKEGERVGRVTAAPTKLLIPAQSRREVVLEFTPNAGFTEAEGRAASLGDAGASLGATTSPESGAGQTRKGTKDGGGGGGGEEEEEEGNDEAMLPPTEKWWQGSVCINAVLAPSEANDVFLVDEFYTLNAERYPSQRVARPLTAAAAGGKDGGSSSSAFSVAQMNVMRPLRTRPGDRVVRRGRIVWPTEAEQRILDRHAAAEAAAAILSGGGSRGKSAAPLLHASSSDDEEDGAYVDASAFAPPSRTRNGADAVATVVPTLEVLLREAEERQALLDSMDHRRRELRAESSRYFTSIELRLRARCGRPHLTIEPSEKCVVFPAMPLAEAAGDAAPTAAAPRCTRTVRFTNRNSAPLRFALAFASSDGVSGGGAGIGAPAGAAAPLFTIVKCALWRSGHDEAAILFPAPGRVGVSAGGGDGAEAGSTHAYLLDSMDALDVTVVAQTHTAAWRSQLAELAECTTDSSSACVSGMLKVQFLPGTSAAAAATDVRAVAEEGAPTQWLPLRVPLAKASIECRPGVVWFRPGQQRHDGRAQVAYTQSFTLYNTSAIPARFHIRPVTGSSGLDSTRDEAMATFRAQQRQQLLLSTMSATVAAAVTAGLAAANTTTTEVGVAGGAEEHRSLSLKVAKVVTMAATAPPAEGRADLVYVDDPAQFTLSPAAGVVPPASLGGEPGEVTVRVDFAEFSEVRYESLFEVVVDDGGAASPAYVVVRGDSRDTEL